MGCYERKLPGEPHFTLLGRDPKAPNYVEAWADDREYDIGQGTRPEADRVHVNEARLLAKEMREWRAANDGKWRAPT